MSMLSILRRNWALRVSVVLNICVLLYVCAHFGSSGPWIEEPPTNWAAPLQSEAFGAVDLVNGTQKGATSSAVPATKDAGNKGVRGNTTNLGRARLLTTRPTPNEAKAEPADRPENKLNQTVSWLSPNSWLFDFSPPTYEVFNAKPVITLPALTSKVLPT